MRVVLTHHDQGVHTHHHVGTVTQHAGQPVQLWAMTGELLVSIEPTAIAYIEIGHD